MIDCDLPVCPSDTCGGEAIECTSTCQLGVFGVDAECPSEEETKTDICPDLCSKFEDYIIDSFYYELKTIGY